MYFMAVLYLKGPQVMEAECQVLKDSMSFMAVLYLKGPQVLEAECQDLKDSMSFILYSSPLFIKMNPPLLPMGFAQKHDRPPHAFTRGCISPHLLRRFRLDCVFLYYLSCNTDCILLRLSPNDGKYDQR